MGTRSATLALALLFGCDGPAVVSPDAATADAAAIGPDAFVAGPITGTFQYVYIDESGTTLATEPVDLTTYTIHALVGGGGSGYQDYSTPGNADGTFVIPDVPGGEYLFGYTTTVGDRFYTYLATSSEREHQVRWVRLQRPDAVPPAPETYLTLQITGLAPWQATDAISLFAPSPGSSWWPSESYGATGLPVIGDEALNVTVPLWQTGARSFLFDAAAGDRARIVQVGSSDGQRGTIATPTRILHTAPFTTPDGTTTVLGGAFEPVPADQSVALEFATSAFEAVRPAVHPDAEISGSYLDVGVFPAWEQYGVTSSGFPDLLLYWIPAGGGDIDETVAYGDPYPPSWGRFAYYQTWFSVPDGTLQETSIGVGLPLAEVATFDGTPVVTPVRNPRIGATSAFVPQSATGTTPVISWDPPQLGGETATYRVWILQRPSGLTTLRSRATILTATTSIEIPPGILDPDRPYRVLVIARTDRGWASAVLAVCTP